MRERRASQKAIRARARISIEFLSIQWEEKFSLPIHLFNARAQKRKKERKRQRKEERINPRDKKNTHAYLSETVWCRPRSAAFSFYYSTCFCLFVLFCSASLFLSKLKCLRERKKKATRVFSPKKLHFCLKNFGPENKKRRKTTWHLMYSAMSSIPSGVPPREEHTQELWYYLRCGA